ncbi:MAG: hypothetical protein OEV74_00430 [Cyclobacteriaceae bacterium]|nr:hypothetical protein [Cyclobacteriaceae bacterium]MDH4294715.1 hypothetical protein [Cyclobacteriaceae bacterium]MDH5247569.1 hypothetical protein [Cyclobacteriaceae bacterium]
MNDKSIFGLGLFFHDGFGFYRHNGCGNAPQDLEQLLLPIYATKKSHVRNWIEHLPANNAQAKGKYQGSICSRYGYCFYAELSVLIFYETDKPI